MRHKTAISVMSSLLLAGCSGSSGGPVDPPPPPSTVASISISGAMASLQVGSTVQLVATLRDASGDPIAGRAVHWSTSASSIATVSDAGLVTAVAPGSATITASVDGIDGTASISVVPAAVVSIALTAPTLAFHVGEVSQYTAQPKDAEGRPFKRVRRSGVPRRKMSPRFRVADS